MGAVEKGINVKADKPRRGWGEFGRSGLEPASLQRQITVKRRPRNPECFADVLHWHRTVGVHPLGHLYPWIVHGHWRSATHSPPCSRRRKPGPGPLLDDAARFAASGRVATVMQ